jgi:hypothetical protein
VNEFAELFQQWQRLIAAETENRGSKFVEAVYDIAAKAIPQGLPEGEFCGCILEIADAHGMLANGGQQEIEATIADAIIRAKTPNPFDQESWERGVEELAERNKAKAAAQTSTNASANEKPPPPEPLVFVDLSKWINAPVPKRRWAVLNRIPAKNVTVLSGNRAAHELTITARVKWIPGSGGSAKSPRWWFTWITWLANTKGPPVNQRINRADLA